MDAGPAMTWTDDYKVKVREFIEAKGQKVQVEEKRYSWQDDDDVSTYGWTDYEAQQHIIGNNPHLPPEQNDHCRWVVPEGAVMYERTYSQFQDTDADNLNEHGVNVKGAHCACGKYTDVILRWTGSVTEMLHSILGLPTSTNIEVTL